MRNLLLLLPFISTVVPALCQERNIELDYYSNELSDIEINEILNYPFFELKENKQIQDLQKKLDSDLNTIATITIHYKYSKTLRLTSPEQMQLEKRMIEIADKFAEIDKYILLKYSGGYSPVFGIKEEIISSKKVLAIMLGGDCTINGIEAKEKKIYNIFNKQIKTNLNPKKANSSG